MSIYCTMWFLDADPCPDFTRPIGPGEDLNTIPTDKIGLSW